MRCTSSKWSITFYFTRSKPRALDWLWNRTRARTWNSTKLRLPEAHWTRAVWTLTFRSISTHLGFWPLRERSLSLKPFAQRHLWRRIILLNIWVWELSTRKATWVRLSNKRCLRSAERLSLIHLPKNMLQMEIWHNQRFRVTTLLLQLLTTRKILIWLDKLILVWLLTPRSCMRLESLLLSSSKRFSNTNKV